MQKRFLAVLLSVCMIISLLPTQAFAVGVGETEGITSQAEGGNAFYYAINPQNGGSVDVKFNGETDDTWKNGNSVLKDTEVTLTVTPATGYKVTSVLFDNGDGAGAQPITPAMAEDGGECTITMPDRMAGVTVNFAQKDYTITSTHTEGGGTVAVAVNGKPATATPIKVHYDDTVTITPTAAEHYDVYSVTLDGNKLDAEEGAYTFKMPAKDVAVATTFKQPHAVSIPTNITDGEVESDHATAMEGETVTLTVKPATGYTYKENTLKVTSGDTVITPELVTGTTDKYSFEMPGAEATVTATFLGNYFGVTVRENLTGGSPTVTITNDDDKSVIAGEGGADYKARAGATVTIESGNTDDGYIIKDATVQNAMSVTTYDVTPEPVKGKTATFTMPAANVTIKYIEYVKPQLTVELHDAATGSDKTTVAVAATKNSNSVAISEASSPYTIDAGATVTLTITVPSGYALTSVTKIATDTTGDPENVNFTAGNNRTYTATFPMEGNATVTVTTKQLYKLTLSKETDSVNGNTITLTDPTVTAEGDGTYYIAADTPVTVTVAADTGYEVKSVQKGTETLSENEGEGKKGTYTFTMPNEDTTVTATFGARTYKITVNGVPGNQAICNTSPEYNAKVEISAPKYITVGTAPDVTYYIYKNVVSATDGVAVSLREDNTTNTYKGEIANMPAKDVTLTATYEQAKVSVVTGTNPVTTNYYPSIDAAIAALSGDATVTLLADNTASAQWTITSGNITLNLNGHKLTKTHPGYTILVGVINSTSNVATLTVTDNSTDKAGSIENDYTGGSSSNLCAEDGGKLIIDGATIGNSKGAASSAIKVNGAKGELLVKEGSVIGHSTGEGTGGVYTRSIQNYGTAVIEGGTFSGSVQVWANTSSTAGNGNLTITGGEFNGAVVLRGTDTLPHNGEMAIKGGTFNKIVGVWISGGGQLGDTINGSVSITGGTFEEPVGIFEEETNGEPKADLIPNPDTALVTIGAVTDQDGNITSAPKFEERPGDSYLDTKFAATLTPTGTPPKYTVVAGHKVSVKGYNATAEDKPYTVVLSAGTVESTDGLLVVPNDAAVKMTLTPATGCGITSVKIGGNDLTPDTEGNYMIPAGNTDVEVVVAYEQVNYTIEIPTMTGGKVTATKTAPTDQAPTITPITTAHYGEKVILIVEPSVGKQLGKDDSGEYALTVTYGVNNTPVPVKQDENVANQFTFTMPNADVNVSATFVDASYTLELEQLFNGDATTDKGTVTVKVNDEAVKLEDLKPIVAEDVLSVVVSDLAKGYDVESVTITTTLYVNLGLGDPVVFPITDKALARQADGSYAFKMENAVMKNPEVGKPDITIKVNYKLKDYTVTATKETVNEAEANGGAVTPTVTHAADHSSFITNSNTLAHIGDTVKFTVTPEANYIIKDATIKVGTGDATSVLSGDANWKEDPDNSGTYTYEVTLHAATADTAELLDNLTFNVKFVKQSTVTVNFDKQNATTQPTATISVNDGTAASLTNGQAWGTKVNAGDQVKITVTPNTGDGIKKVTGLTTGLTLTGNTITFTMPATDVNLSVEYMTPVTLTLTNTTIAHGSVVVKHTPGGDTNAITVTPVDGVYTVDQNATVEIIATAADGYELDTLTYDGNAVTTGISATGNASTYTISNYQGGKAFGVTFKASNQTGTLDIKENGSLMLTGTGVSVAADKKSFTAPTDTEVTITVTPNPGYEIDTMTVKVGTENVPVTNNKFTMPATGTVVITVTFKAIEYDITVVKDGEAGKGTVTLKDSNNVDVTKAITDTDLVLTAETESGYQAEVKISYWMNLTIGNNAPKRVEITETLEAASDGKTYNFKMPGSETNVTVTIKEVEVPDTAVAAIGSTGYPTVDAAFAAVQDGQTIVLMKTATASGQLTVSGKNITLDLNGNTLTKTHSGYTVSVDNGGDLTITDSKSGGKITNGYESGPSTTLQANNGKLIIESGIIENGLTGECSAIKVEKQGTLEINGGSIGKAKNDGVMGRSIQSFGAVTINDGTVQGVIQVWTAIGEDVKPGTLTINNGTFQDSVVVCNGAGYPLTGEVTINGGTFSGPAKTDAYTPMVGVRIPPVGYEVAGEVPKMTINGGTFNVETGIWRAGENGGFLTEDEAKTRSYLTIEDGSFSTEPKASDVAADKVAVKGTDGRWTIADAVALTLGNEVENGSVAVQYTPSGTATAVSVDAVNGVYTVAKGSKVEIIATANPGYELDALTIGTDKATVSTSGNTYTYTGTIEADKTFNVTFKGALRPVTLNVADGSVVLTGDGVESTTSNGTTTYKVPTGTEVTVTATPDAGYDAAEPVTVTGADFKDGKFTMPATGDVTISATFTAHLYTVEVPETTNGTATVTGTTENKATTGTELTITTAPAAGYETSKVEISYKMGTVTVTQEIEGTNNAYKFNMPGADVKVIVTFKKIDVAPESVASIGTKGYTDIATAFAEATNGQTIVLLKDVTASGQLTVSNKNVTLDLNGNTLTKTHSGYTVSVGDKGNLTITDSKGGGKIANGYTGGASTTLQVNNGGELIIESGTIVNGLTPNCSAIKVEELGTLTVNGGIIGASATGGVNTRSIQTFGITTIKGGTFEGAIQVWTYADSKNDNKPYSSKLTINGGTFQNGVIICGTVNVTAGYPFGGTVEINGGTFNAGENDKNKSSAMVAIRIPAWTNATASDFTDVDLTINGGTFDVPVGVYSNEETKFVTNAKYHLNIVGGSFGADYKPDASDIAEGKTAVKVSNRWTIADKEPEPVIYVAEVTIGDKTTQYETIKAAFDAVTTGEATITLLTDVLDAPVLSMDVAKNITLDLNGHTLSKTHSGYTIAVNKGTLTVIDTVGGGKIANGYTGGPSSTLRANNGGTVIIGSADKAENNFTIANALKQSDCSAIKVDENGTLVVNGGTIGKSVSDSVNSRSIQTFGTTTIKGGTIEGVVQVWTWTETGKTFNPSALTIEGGTFQDSVIICSTEKVDANCVFGGTVTINGGIFTNEDAMVAVYIPNWGDDLAANTGSGEYAPKMTINGGMFDAKVGVYDLGVEDTDKWLTVASYLTINGGSFKTEPKANDIAEGYEAMKGNDGRYTIVEKTAEEPVDVNAAAEAPTKTETAEDGTVTAAATVDENVINAAIEAAAKKEGVDVGAVATVPAITITATTPEGSETKAKVTEVKLTKEVVDMLVGEGGYETETVTIKTDTGDVTLPSEVLKKAPADGLTLVVGASSAQGEGNEGKVTSPFEVTIYDGAGKEVVDIKNLDTPIKMTINVGTKKLPEGSMLAYWDDVKKQYITISGATYAYDETNGGTFTFTVNHLTHFAVITPEQVSAVYKIASCTETPTATEGKKQLAVNLTGNFNGKQFVTVVITYGEGKDAYTATISQSVEGLDKTIMFEYENVTMVTVYLSETMYSQDNYFDSYIVTPSENG